MNDDARFWGKVDKSGDCWEWTGTRVGGYGQAWFEGRSQYAHRVSVTLSGRTIPVGMQVDHLCRNRACVRPDHLDVVSASVNVKRSHDAVPHRARSVKPKADFQNADLLSTADVARMSGVSVRTVHRWVDAGRLTPTVVAPGPRGARLFDRRDVALLLAELKKSA